MVGFRAPAACLSSFALARNIGSYVTGRIAKDEDIVFFPTLANELNETHWQVPIHGWIFEPERQDKKRLAFLALLRKALHIKDETEEIMLRRRVQPFLVDNERWKSPRIQILGQIHRLPLSGKNGHFRGTIEISKEETRDLQQDGLLPIEATAPDGRSFKGSVHLVPSIGLSVISDIDDTIKISNVTDKKSLLRNTFLREFKEVPGMAGLYTQWQRDHQAMFHFVSSSPYQLYEELEKFRRHAGFPASTFHLKSIRPKDKSILNLFADPFKTKTKEITAILDRFPQRKYILVGDSGERDPEVYANLARVYPKQIVGIFIRNVSQGQGGLEGRLEEAFLDVPPTKWSVFNDATEIKIEKETLR